MTEKEKKVNDIGMEIDWAALEEHWPKEYEEDYIGKVFVRALTENAKENCMQNYPNVSNDIDILLIFGKGATDEEKVYYG